MRAAILLALACSALAGPSYLSDPVLQRVAAESHGALKPVTRFWSWDRWRTPLTGRGGVSLHDFSHAAPRTNGPFLDAALIALELSDHNWPLARILTATGGVDVERATIALTSGATDANGTQSVLAAPVQHRWRWGEWGRGAWWIEAYDAAVSDAKKQNYFANDAAGDAYYTLFTGYTSTYLGTGRYAHRLWTEYVTESVKAQSPVVLGTRPASEWNGTLKASHAYAVEGITAASNQDDPYAIATITLRDAETATRGVTYNWTNLQVDINGLYFLDPRHNGPGQT